MSRHYRLTATAVADLDAIWLYIAGSSPERADRFLEVVERMLQMLADYPMVGRERPEFGLTLRSYPVGDYLIFYVPISDGVEIRTVLHGAQDLSRFFLPE